MMGKIYRGVKTLTIKTYGLDDGTEEHICNAPISKEVLEAILKVL